MAGFKVCRRWSSCISKTLRDVMEHVMGVGFVGEVESLLFLVILGLTLGYIMYVLLIQLLDEESVAASESSGAVTAVMFSNTALHTPEGQICVTTFASALYNWTTRTTEYTPTTVGDVQVSMRIRSPMGEFMPPPPDVVVSTTVNQLADRWDRHLPIPGARPGDIGNSYIGTGFNLLFNTDFDSMFGCQITNLPGGTWPPPGQGGGVCNAVITCTNDTYIGDKRLSSYRGYQLRDPRLPYTWNLTLSGTSFTLVGKNFVRCYDGDFRSCTDTMPGMVYDIEEITMHGVVTTDLCSDVAFNGTANFNRMLGWFVARLWAYPQGINSPGAASVNSQLSAVVSGTTPSVTCFGSEKQDVETAFGNASGLVKLLAGVLAIFFGIFLSQVCCSRLWKPCGRCYRACMRSIGCTCCVGSATVQPYSAKAKTDKPVNDNAPNMSAPTLDGDEAAPPQVPPMTSNDKAGNSVWSMPEEEKPEAEDVDIRESRSWCSIVMVFFDKVLDGIIGVAVVAKVRNVFLLAVLGVSVIAGTIWLTMQLQAVKVVQLYEYSPPLSEVMASNRLTIPEDTYCVTKGSYANGMWYAKHPDLTGPFAFSARSQSPLGTFYSTVPDSEAGSAINVDRWDINFVNNCTLQGNLLPQAGGGVFSCRDIPGPRYPVDNDLWHVRVTCGATPTIHFNTFLNWGSSYPLGVNRQATYHFQWLDKEHCIRSNLHPCLPNRWYIDSNIKFGIAVPGWIGVSNDGNFEDLKILPKPFSMGPPEAAFTWPADHLTPATGLRFDPCTRYATNESARAGLHQLVKELWMRPTNTSGLSLEQIAQSSENPEWKEALAGQDGPSLLCLQASDTEFLEALGGATNAITIIAAVLGIIALWCHRLCCSSKLVPDKKALPRAALKNHSFSRLSLAQEVGAEDPGKMVTADGAADAADPATAEPADVEAGVPTKRPPEAWSANHSKAVKETEEEEDDDEEDEEEEDETSCRSFVLDVDGYVFGAGFVSRIRSLWVLIPATLLMGAAFYYVVAERELTKTSTALSLTPSQASDIMGSNYLTLDEGALCFSVQKSKTISWTPTQTAGGIVSSSTVSATVTSPLGKVYTPVDEAYQHRVIHMDRWDANLFKCSLSMAAGSPAWPPSGTATSKFQCVGTSDFAPHTLFNMTMGCSVSGGTYPVTISASHTPCVLGNRRRCDDALGVVWGMDLSFQLALAVNPCTTYPTVSAVSSQLFPSLKLVWEVPVPMAGVTSYNTSNQNAAYATILQGVSGPDLICATEEDADLLEAIGTGTGQIQLLAALVAVILSATKRFCKCCCCCCCGTKKKTEDNKKEVH